VIDFLATRPHYADHLRPVWAAIPVEHRGVLSDQATVGDGPLVVASSTDLAWALRCRRPVVLMEHGAGQSYSNRHSSYAGGRGRDGVAMFLVPSGAVADRNRQKYPRIPNVVVGSPRVDALLGVSGFSTEPAGVKTGNPGCRTVAVSFHWRCTVAPEAGSAIDDFFPEMLATAWQLRREGVDLIGHAHPRIADEAEAMFRAAGIEFIPTFDEVVARADLYAVDNSSTLFEFAALDRPVVVLNARAYRRNVHHGLRFWSEADVGLHAEPGELAATILAALADPPDVARSRRAAVSRVYAVLDGTSAARAADAIMSLLDSRAINVRHGRRVCLICGVANHTCGPATTVTAVDLPTDAPKESGMLKRYPNPDRPGAFVKLTESTARRMGLEPPVSAPGWPETVPGAPEGPDPRVSAQDGPSGGLLADGEKDQPPPEPKDDPKDKARPAPARRRRAVSP
jgi:hypothetical protein